MQTSGRHENILLRDEKSIDCLIFNYLPISLTGLNALE